MPAVLEYFIRNSDNQIKLQLQEDGQDISGNWTELDVFIGGVNLNRAADGDGVSLSAVTGILVITPADLLAAEIAELDALPANRTYNVQVVVTSVLNDDGAVFGAKGSSPIKFYITDKPAV